jgi:adenylate cyclase
MITLTSLPRGHALTNGCAIRVLRTVLFIDIFESVRLMEDDEYDIVRRWLELVALVEDKILPAHEGRLVKSMGDGLLLEFRGVQSCVKAAFAIQRVSRKINRGVSPKRHMLLRMGAHAGQIIAGEHDVYGRDVNLAARLTTLAGPGEIVVSADVRDQLTPIIDADLEDLGACYLKHVHEPVRAYRVGPPGPHPVIDVGSASMPELRPTIAAIPFACRGPDQGHYVVGEIMADEIISALAHSSELNVISRLSSTAFRGRDVSVTEVSGHLNATYVLSGAYRVSGNVLRITAELARGSSGSIVWSEIFEGRVTGILKGSDGLIDKLVAGISNAIMMKELQRAQTQPMPSLESYTLLLAAITLMHRLSRDDFDRARQMILALTERAPRQAIPWAWLAKWHVLRVQQGWSDDPKAEGQFALDCARRALDADPRCSLALAMAGFVHTNLFKSFDKGYESYELALYVNPNDSLALLLKGTLHAFRGEGKLAVDATRRALKLSPLDPHRYFYDSLAATASLSAGQYKRSIELAKRSLRANRTHTSTFRALAISQWQLGQRKEARSTVSELLKLDPTLTIRSYLERNPSSGFPTGAIWSTALREAGVPA